MAKIDLTKLLKDHGTTLAGLASSVKVNKSTVTRWAQNRVPAERVLDVEKATGIDRHKLRPDIYPQPYSKSGVAA